jgi:hypothetical protein
MTEYWHHQLNLHDPKLMPQLNTHELAQWVFDQTESRANYTCILKSQLKGKHFLARHSKGDDHVSAYLLEIGAHPVHLAHSHGESDSASRPRHEHALISLRATQHQVSRTKTTGWTSSTASSMRSRRCSTPSTPSRGAS